MNNSRMPFDSRFNIAEATLKIPSFTLIDDKNISRMYDFFNRWGFVLVTLCSPRDLSYELEVLQKYFGNVIRHNRSNASGMSLIKLMPGHPDYFGTTNNDTGLHTDGACSTQPPPKVVILQCEMPSRQGGDSQLLSCKRLYDYLKQTASDHLNALFQSDVFTITRDKESTKRPVFYYDGNRIFTVFRPNGTAEIKPSPKAKKAFKLVEEFTKKENNILQLKLKKNQILVIDNTSVMHGRKAFSKDSMRKLNRIFLDGNIKHAEQIYFGFEA